MQPLILDEKSLPSRPETVKLLNQLASNKHLIIIVGECRVDYIGRSRSILPWGERVIFIKQDGAVLVHRPAGYSPVNWQPTTSSIVFEDTGDSILMTAVRSSPREIMHVYIRGLKIIFAYRLTDNAKFTMYVSEDEIKDVIAEDPSLIEEGLTITGREVKAGSGYIDLLGKDRDGTIVILEVKDEKAGIEAGKQLLRYVEQYRRRGIKARGVLVAPGFTKSLIGLLDRNKLEWKQLEYDKILTIITGKSAMKRGGHTDLRAYITGEQGDKE